MAEFNGNGSLPSVMAILARARQVGLESWRVGIALGVEPAQLELMERQLDEQPRAHGALPAPPAGGYEPAV